MASTLSSNPVCKAKFRGCMIGGLVGDCVGEPFEFPFSPPSKDTLNDFMNAVLNEECERLLRHTDDTKMTLCIASSLVDKGEFNSKDIAERFVNEFYRDPHRRYENNVRFVFKSLKESKFEDIFLPAKSQFKGAGSFGNGGAMRTAPIALFGNNKGEEYIMDTAKECALITHTHRDGYRGAMLQCLAVKTALELDSSKELDPVFFIDTLREKMKNIEKGNTLFDKMQQIYQHRESVNNMDVKPFCASLKRMKTIFLENKNYSPEEIALCLGNGHDVSALKAVPPAIYSFLIGMKPFEGFLENSNPFVRTVFFAVSLGGDTDTIASMAGSIAGAYYGEDIIPDVLKKRCEGIDEMSVLADKLFDVTYKNE